MKFISLFAGVGGFDLALERQGHECVYVNEWDKYSVITYEKNFCKGTERQIPIPQERQEEVGNSGHGRDEAIRNSRYGFSSSHGESDRNESAHPRVDTRSITDVPATEIPDHDLLVGGFPCQSFSIAGKRRGFDDTRGTLFFEIARILKDKKTKYFILENVKGLLSHDNGNTFKTIIATLDELGYDLQWQVLNSKNFGVPQNRERVFIVGHLRGTPRPKVFPIGEDAQVSTKRQGQISPTITQRYYKQGQSDPYIVVEKPDAGEQSLLKERDKPDSPDSPDSRGRATHSSDIRPAQWRRTEKGKQFRREAQKRGRDMTPFNNDYRELVPKDSNIIGAITSQAIAKDSLLFNKMRIRRLTPLECQRLQGFPDDFYDGIEMSDTQKYKQMGNAVTVNVVEAIIKRFLF